MMIKPNNNVKVRYYNSQILIFHESEYDLYLETSLIHLNNNLLLHILLMEV